MALRLTTASAPKTARRSPLELSALARAALMKGDLNTYRDLFAQATEDENPHRRFRSRTTLIEAGMGAMKAIPPRSVAQVWLVIARAGLEILEEEPREPVLLNYVGVAFYELGALKPAEQLFKAARRLDVQLPHVARNLNEIARRRRKNVDLISQLPPAISLAVPPLARRVEKVAAAAVPAKDMKISLVMIVKDEEEMLPRCLEAVHDAVDEMVIVDTGSSDSTVEIAESFGARVLHHEWTGDFAEARNLSLEAATGDWFLYLDADEVLVREDAPRLREMAGETWREAFFFVETNFTGDLDDGMAVNHNTLRMYRNRPEYRFEGRIHEQIAHCLPGGMPERIGQPSVRIEHYGYLGAVRDAKEKSRRNIELLERQLEESKPTAFLCFNLGSEYAAAGDAQRALYEFERAWMLLRGDPEMISYGFVPSLTNRLVKALRSTGDRKRASERADEGLEIFPGFTDLVFEQAQCAREEGDLEKAAELVERCLEMGDAPSRYSPMVGCGSYLALGMLADIRREQGDYPSCQRLLIESLESHPGFLGAVHPLGAIMLAQGTAPDEVVAMIESVVAKLTPNVHFMLGSALYEQRHAEAAEAQFRALLAKQPSSDAARVALSETLLSQCRWSEAAEAVTGVEPESGYAQVALRSELFARIMDRDADGAKLALDRAEAANMHRADLAFFRAWYDLRTAEAPADGLPLEAGALLCVTLEALLRVHEVQAFAELVPLVERVGLPWREQRELLGAMYLRRGFLESAGDEWVAVVETAGPDARAMFGLAQVAASRGLLEDASFFAEQARELDPGHAGADRLLGAIATAA
ncbi:MAG TPA: glycosyltransferase [Thermoleophilaceae bacterium]|nr:glycosyltransferase [Thermoleophilaceae bacterium]